MYTVRNLGAKMKILNNHPAVSEHRHCAARLTRRTLFSTMLPGAILAPCAFPESASDMAERFRQMSADFERKGLAEPFTGITVNGTAEPGLFGIHSSGVSTGPVRTAAERFLSSLTREQRGRTEPGSGHAAGA